MARSLSSLRFSICRRAARVYCDFAITTHGFNHGFTTKSDGHGFGLHASANSAKQMGGTLGVASDGPGTGAIFTLEFPVNAEAIAV